MKRIRWIPGFLTVVMIALGPVSGQRKIVSAQVSFSKYLPALSPDGKYVAYIADNDPSELDVMTIDGGKVIRLAQSVPYDTYADTPSWSPDSKQIAFVTQPDSHRLIYVANADGSGSQLISQADSDSADPVWSPDGKHIAYASANIFIVDTDGSNRHALTRNSAPNGDLAWSPDGKFIAFSSDFEGNQQIFIADVVGLTVRNLTRDAEQHTQPAWSPDGKFIAFTSIDSNAQTPFWHLSVMTSSGSNSWTAAKVAGSVALYRPAWSPDGHWIAISEGSGMTSRLWLVNARSLYAINITPNAAQNLNPNWFPDSRRLLFASTMMGSSELFTITMYRNGFSLGGLTIKLRLPTEG